jgi:hypothetical protein
MNFRDGYLTALLDKNTIDHHPHPRQCHICTFFHSNSQLLHKHTEKPPCSSSSHLKNDEIFFRIQNPSEWIWVICLLFSSHLSGCSLIRVPACVILRLGGELVVNLWFFKPLHHSFIVLLSISVNNNEIRINNNTLFNKKIMFDKKRWREIHI